MMMMKNILPSLVLLLSLIQHIKANLDYRYVDCGWFYDSPNNMNPATIHGKRFYDSQTGEYVPIKGIAYYPRPNAGPLEVTNSVDFFTEEFRDLWEADIENFVRLGVNTIRIYGVDPSANHDRFMCALEQAGIYAVIGLLADCENCAIGSQPAPECYPPTLKARGQFIINSFSKYRNTLAFSAGNEVALYARDEGGETAWNAPCQKQFLRDMRAYINSCNAVPHSVLPRKVPVGVVTADFDRSLNALYYGCRTDPADELENAEWYGINAYRHCDPNAMSIDDLNGYLLLKQDFASYNLPIPVVIAEFGCRERFPTIGQFEAQRTWLQVDAIFSESYQEEFVGGIVFEYSAEKIIVDESDQNKPWPYFEFMKLQYGVGYYDPVDCDHINVPCQYIEYPEFQLLANKYQNIDVSFIPSLDLSAGATDMELMVPECPAEFAPLDAFDWISTTELDMPCYTWPTPSPSTTPSAQPTSISSASPSGEPTMAPSGVPTMTPSGSPTGAPATAASIEQTAAPVSTSNTAPTSSELDVENSGSADAAISADNSSSSAATTTSMLFSGTIYATLGLLVYFCI